MLNKTTENFLLCSYENSMLRLTMTLFSRYFMLSDCQDYGHSLVVGSVEFSVSLAAERSRFSIHNNESFILIDTNFLNSLSINLKSFRFSFCNFLMTTFSDVGRQREDYSRLVLTLYKHKWQLKWWQFSIFRELIWNCHDDNNGSHYMRKMKNVWGCFVHAI